jgi:hypothetical protein
MTPKERQRRRELRSDIFLENIEEADCGLIAIQAVTGMKRAAVERLAEEEFKGRTGMRRGSIEELLLQAGYSCETLAVDPRLETPATFSLTHEWGRFLLYTNSPEGKGHVQALVEGDLHNARGSWSCPLLAVTKVTKEEP